MHYTCIKCKKRYLKYSVSSSPDHVDNLLCKDCDEAWFDFVQTYLKPTKKDASELFNDFLNGVTPIARLDRVS